MQPWNEAARVHFFGATRSVTETDDVSARLLETGCERQSLGPVRKRNVACLAIAVVAHENRELATGAENRCTVLDQLVVSMKEILERWRCAHIPFVGAIHFHAPVRRMNPDEVERTNSFEGRRITRIEAEADIFGCTEHIEFITDVSTCATARHGIKNSSWLKEANEVFD